jgi:hypothetical protein
MAPVAADIPVGTARLAKAHPYSESLAVYLQGIKYSQTLVVGDLIRNWAQKMDIELDGLISNPHVKAPTEQEKQSRRSHRHTITFSIKIREISKVRIYIVAPGAKSSTGVSFVGDDYKIASAAYSNERTLGDLLSSFDLNISPLPGETVRRNVTCTHVLSRPEVAIFPGNDPSEREREVDREYEAVAATYAAYLFSKGVHPGVPPPVDLAEKMKEANLFISNGFASTSRAPKFSANGTLHLVFENIAPVHRVKIDVAGNPVNTGGIARAFNKLYLLDGGKRSLVNGPRHILLRDALVADLELLQSADDIVTADWEMESPGDLHFIVTPKERVNRQIRFTAGFGYSPEKSATATFAADVSQATASEDSLKFTLEGGPQTLAGDGEINLPLWNHPDALRFVASAGSEALEIAYYGNITRGSVESTRSEGKLGLRYEMDFTSHYERYEARRALRKSRERLGNKISVEGGLHYTYLSLDGATAATAGLDEGDNTGLYLTLAHQAEYDLRNRAGTHTWQSFLLTSRLDFDSGFEGIGDSDDFTKVLLQSEARAIFRSRGNIAGYAAAGLTGGWASSDTPTYMAFGAGGARFVRGLQQDEFIGREYFGGGVEAGLNVGWILSRIEGKDSLNKKPVDQTKPSAKLTLQQVYLALFADYGNLSDRTSDGVPISGSRNFQGYGIQLQVMDAAVWNHGASLAIGYAWSPQSEINESGTIFTKAFFQF